MLILNKIKKFIKYNKISFNENFKFLPRNTDNIAIIGNSSSLKNNCHGKTIDKYQYVIRFNRAPTKNYEKFVGTKTNLRVVGTAEFKNIPYDLKNFKTSNNPRKDNYVNYIKNLKNTNILVITDDKISHLKKNKNKYSHHTNKIYFFNNELNNFIKFKIISRYNIFKKIYYYYYCPALSSGILMTSLLILLKNKPTLFGFEIEKKDDIYNHYFANHHGKIDKPYHNYKLEGNILKKLIKEKLVNYIN
jgi:hypothetical protein